MRALIFSLAILAAMVAIAVWQTSRGQVFTAEVRQVEQ